MSVDNRDVAFNLVCLMVSGHKYDHAAFNEQIAMATLTVLLYRMLNISGRLRAGWPPVSYRNS